MEVDTESTTNSHRSLNSVYSDPSFSESGKPCDALLQTDDGSEFQVHSKVLSKQSEFFKDLFSLSEENGQSTVIHGIKPDTFETVLIYLCTGRVDLHPQNMMDLLVTSDFLRIESLTSECRRFALQNKTIDNCLILFLTASRIKGLDMEPQCRRFLEINFERVVEHSADGASMLPCDALKYILSSKSLNVSSERAVWSFIKAWVQTDPSNRIPVAPELLRCLYINEIDDDLASELISSPLIRESKLYEDLGDPNVTMAHLSDKDKAFVMMSRNGAPLLDGIRQPRSVYFVTKRSSDYPGPEMFVTYDDSLDVWRKLGDTSCPPTSLYRVGHMVYGVMEYKYWMDHEYQEAFKYDLLRGVITPMTPPPSNLQYVMEASGHIYALGEDDPSQESEEIREYVDETDEWVRITPMPPSFVEGTVSCGTLLYVISRTRQHSMAMQVYDPSADRWEALAPPRVRRTDISAVEHREKLFLIGGLVIDQGGRKKTSRAVEVYDPVRDEWVFYPELSVEFENEYVNYDMMVKVVKGRLFVCNYSDPCILDDQLVTYLDESCWEWRKIEDSSPLHTEEHHMGNYCFCPIEDEDLVGEVVKKNKSCDVSEWLQTGLENETLLKSSTYEITPLSQIL